MNHFRKWWLSLFLVSALLLALAPAGVAAGINLSWDDCGSHGSSNRDFACNTNTGNNDMYASFDPPAGLTFVIGNLLTLDLQSASSTLPLWWQFKSLGSCRVAGLTATAPIPGTCADPWHGQAVAAISNYWTYGSLPDIPMNRARINAFAVIPTVPNPVSAGTEYFSLIIRSNNSKTVGTPSCSGCLVPVCIVLNEIQIVQPLGTPGGDPRLTTPLTSNYITWQGGTIGGAGCPGATPALNRTWGALKSLYR